MIEKKILIPVDFTNAADKATEFGIFLAPQMNAKITLLNVCDDSMSVKECESKMDRIAKKIDSSAGFHCDFLCEKGNIFNVIPEVASRNAYDLMVIATHGRKGLRQKFLGPDILKLLKKMPVPSLVVQENSVLHDDAFKSAVFPVGGHDAYENNINAMILMAGVFDPEIHLYSISRAGFEQTEKLRENILMAEKGFSEKGIRFKRVIENQNVFSVGYAKQTLKYAHEKNAGLLAIMTTATQEHYYFADSDKETILTNEYNIPVLCSSNIRHDL